jgi:hypothetical protein
MRSYALTLGSVLVCSSLSACTFGNNGDYQVSVPWTVNGEVPSPASCQEQHIASGRFEVFTSSGKKLKTLASGCAGTITLSDGNEYGGLLTSRSFEWDRTYQYTLTLVDAAGNPVSTPVQGSFELPFDNADIYELPYLDYLNASGTAAGLSGEWSVRANPDVAAACLADRITKVRILVASALDLKLEDAAQVAEANCAEGRVVSVGKVLATGDYLFQYVAVSDGGNVVQAGVAVPVTVDGTQDVALPREMFLSN